MNDVGTLETYEPLTREQLVIEQVPVSTKQALPAAPFPRKYVLSVFVDLQDASQAARALRAAGFDEQGSTSCRAAMLWKRWHSTSRLSTSLPQLTTIYTCARRAGGAFSWLCVLPAMPS
jgi:hypothetical protein